MKKLLVALIALMLVLPVAFVACKSEKSEEPMTDATTEEALAKTEATTEKTPEAPEIVTRQYTVSFKLDNGNVLPDAKVTFKQGENEYPLVSGKDGTATIELAIGKYSISYDYDSLPAGCYPETTSVDLTADALEITLIVVDNNPNGSPAKPFYIMEDVTALSLEVGSELHYVYRGAAVRYLTIESNGVSVVYKGEEYKAENGKVTVVITPKMGEMTSFSVKNNTAAKIESSLSMLSPEGSMENPHKLTGNLAEASVPAGEAVYYAYVAEKSGMLVVSSENALNNIALTNSNTYAVTSFTAGGKGTYIAVSKGDTVIITVSSTDSEHAAVIDVHVSCYAGTAEDPVPVINDSIEITFSAGSAITFFAEVGKTVSFSNQSVTLKVGDKEYTPNSTMAVSLSLSGDGETVAFTLINNSNSPVSLSFKVK